MGNQETTLQRQIMVALSRDCVLVRVPTGQYWAGKYDKGIILNPRPVKVAVTGFPDLAGYRRSDGRAVYIEVKTDRGVVSKEQEQFITVARKAGCLAGIARSIDEAKEIIERE